MKKFVSVVISILIIVVLSPKSSNAESLDIVDEKITIIQNCEKIFPDLEKLGTEKFRQRYMHFTDFRSCTILYNDQIWYSNDTKRIEKLVTLLEKPIRISSIRDRFTQSQTIPDWIKEDAKRWYHEKERDNIFSYGIRYLINSNMIPTPISPSVLRSCEERICVAQNDFIKYSVKDSGSQDVLALTHTFQKVDENSIIITAEEVSKIGKTLNNFQINSDGIFNFPEQKCCNYYKFVHKIPLQFGAEINSDFDIQLTSEVIYPFKDQKRTALMATDRTGSYYEIIDKQTGVVLFVKQHDRIKKLVWTEELVDTNIFTKDIKIQYEDMRIPSWFKTVVRWWTEGKITDSEYLSSLGYLLKHDILHI